MLDNCHHVGMKTKQIYKNVYCNILQVNFKEMMMFKPNKRMIRRSFQDGIWVQYKTSPHQVQFHAKINRVQVSTRNFYNQFMFITYSLIGTTLYRDKFLLNLF